MLGQVNQVNSFLDFWLDLIELHRRYFNSPLLLTTSTILLCTFTLSTSYHLVAKNSTPASFTISASHNQLFNIPIVIFSFQARVMPRAKPSERSSDKQTQRKSARLACKKNNNNFKLSNKSSSSTSNTTCILNTAGLTAPRLLSSPSPKTSLAPRDSDLLGHQLVGREILVCWDDGHWYDAVVIRYYPQADEYKLAYRSDEAIEITSLYNRRWTVAPKKISSPSQVVLDGAIVEFMYPPDGLRYKAMIFDASASGDRIKVAYLDDHSTDHLKGRGWDFLTTSPCLRDDSAEPSGVPNVYFISDVEPTQGTNPPGTRPPSAVAVGRVSKPRSKNSKSKKSKSKKSKSAS